MFLDRCRADAVAGAKIGYLSLLSRESRTVTLSFRIF